jgi:hypothetical protein
VYITQAVLHNFRKAITNAWGSPVTSQRDCIQLANHITEKTGRKMASHTLRRFFGLVSFDGQFRKSTLDILAQYADYGTIEELIDRLKNEEDLIELLVRLQVENVDIDEYYITRLMERDVSMEAVMMAGHMIIIRLEQGDQDRVIRLFQTIDRLETKNLQYWPISYVFAHYVAPKFYEVEDEQFIERLMTETNYLDSVLSFFVPLDDMDGGFGRHIRAMLELSQDDEHQAFGHSLLATEALQSGDQDLAEAHLDEIPQREAPYFSILQGRIDALHFLLKGKTTTNASDHFSPLPNEELFYFKAILPLLIQFGETDMLEDILQRHRLRSVRPNHWMEESVKKQIELATSWLLAVRGKKTESKEALEQAEAFPFPRDYKGASNAMIEATRLVLNH